MEISPRKIKSLAFLLLILTSAVLSFSFLPEARAETQIVSMTPSSGYVGTTVQLTGNITYVNGTYEIRFDQVLLMRGNATENYVNASFAIPPTTAGNHSVTISDIAALENDTETFTVLTSYSLEVQKLGPPQQRQQGDQVQAFLNITGGERTGTTANITIQAPSNVSYSQPYNVSISEDGNGTLVINYPEDFPPDANTNLTGNYDVSVNATAKTSFFIGLTNATEYHRFQTVDIKAAYKSGENVTLTITGKDLYYPVNLTADESGIVYYGDSTILNNASIGTYMVNITSISSLNQTIKNPPDIQNFTVPGFDVNITTRNRAREYVPNVTVEALEEGRSVANATSDLSGLAILKLEVGNYTGEASFKGEKVGERVINVTDSTFLDFECNLTNLRILVVDQDEIRIPMVKIYLSPENQTLTTNIDGMAEVHSVLPKVTYVLNASRYDLPFAINFTIPHLLVGETVVAWFNVTVLCPALTLRVNVTEADGEPVNDAVVNVYELMGGLYYEQNTTFDGSSVFRCTFGNYTIEVYVSGIKLASTTVELFQDQNLSINCRLCGLTVLVRVVDYFGHPILNANVTWQRDGLQISRLTKSDGIATFNNVIGGDSQLAVYLFGQSQPCVVTTSSITGSSTIEIKIQKYVTLAGFLVETSQLITAIIIGVTLILLLFVEVYRRKRLKLKKSTN